jgi:hypothetical protein
VCGGAATAMLLMALAAATTVLAIAQTPEKKTADHFSLPPIILQADHYYEPLPQETGSAA